MTPLSLSLSPVEKDESVSRSYLSELQNISLHLDESEQRLIRAIQTPPPSRLLGDGVDDTPQIAEQEVSLRPRPRFLEKVWPLLGCYSAPPFPLLSRSCSRIWTPCAPVWATCLAAASVSSRRSRRPPLFPSSGRNSTRLWRRRTNCTTSPPST